MSTERGQNWSGIYDWYGLFWYFFDSEGTSSSSSSSVPKPCVEPKDKVYTLQFPTWYMYNTIFDVSGEIGLVNCSRLVYSQCRKPCY